MLHRLALAAALAFAALAMPAEAQVPRVVSSCGSSSIPVGPGGYQTVDTSGNLCTTGGSGGASSTGSVTAAGTPGTQAQAVQGIPNGVAQNTYPCQYNATLPTMASGSSGYASCDANGRPLVVLASGASNIGSVFLVHSSAPAAGIVPVTSTGSTLVGKASAGNLYGYHATFGATAGYVAILNATAAPAAGAAITPIECTPIAANSSYRARQDIPDRYNTGVVLLATSSCTTYTAVTPQMMASLVD